MVDRHVVGRGTAGAVRYAFEGRRDTPSDKQPYLLGWRGVGTSSLEEMVADFEIGQQANQRLDNVVWHVSLSFNPTDAARLDNRKMLEIAEGYLEKMGMAQTQYLVVRHHDTAHQHLHIIASRVDDAGKAVADGQNFIDSKKKLQELIEQHGLTAPKGLRPDLQHPEKLHGTDLVRCELRQVLRQELGTATNLTDLTASLKNQGLDVRYRLNQAGEPTGISFAKDKIACRGSELGKDYSLTGIERQLAANLARHQVAEAERQAQQQAQERERQTQQLQEKTSAALERQLPGATNLDELQRRLFLTELLHTQAVVGVDGQLQELVFSEAGKPNRRVRASELALPYQAASLQQTLDQQRAARLEAEQRQTAETARLEAERQQAVARQLAEQQAAAQRAAAQRAAEATRQANQREAERQAAEQARQEAARRQTESWRDQLREQAKQLAHLAEQAQQAELVGDYGRVAQLRYGDMHEVQRQREVVEQQAAATASGLTMLVELRIEEAAQAQAAKQELKPAQATQVTAKQEEITGTATTLAVVSTQQATVEAKVIEAVPSPGKVTPAQATTTIPLGIDFEARFQQYEQERRSVQRHNAAVDYVGCLLNREPGSKQVNEALTYAQTDRAPFREKAHLVAALQQELKRHQQHEEWVKGLHEHKADLEKQAKKWSGWSSKAMAAQNELAELQIPEPLKAEIYLRRYLQPEPVELSQEQFIRQQQTSLTQLRTKLSSVLTKGVASWDTFVILTESEGVKMKRSADNKVTFHFEAGNQTYRAAEVLPDFAAQFSQGLERGLNQKARQRSQESTKNRQREM